MKYIFFKHSFVPEWGANPSSKDDDSYIDAHICNITPAQERIIKQYESMRIDYEETLYEILGDKYYE